VHFVYIVRCADGTLYTGYAKDPTARERVHNAGRGAKYTAGRRPVQLVYREAWRSRGRALAREHAIKQLSRVEKECLITAANDEARSTSSRASKSETRRRRRVPVSMS
jgi:putative endonuclease